MVRSCLTWLLGTRLSSLSSALYRRVTSQQRQTVKLLEENTEIFLLLWLEKNVKYGKDWKLHYSKLSETPSKTQMEPAVVSAAWAREGGAGLI